MTNNAYSLQTLLELRTDQRAQAEELLAKQLAELELAKRALLSAKQAYKAAKTLRETRQSELDASRLEAGIYMAAWRLEEDYVKKLLELEDEEQKQAVLDAEHALQEQQKRVQNATNELLFCRQEEEVVLKHKKRWQSEQKVLENRALEAEMDDIAARIWRQGQ